MDKGAVIKVEKNEYGGRLKYFHKLADERFWDELWDSMAPSVDYLQAESGHLPLQLRRTFLKWAAPGSRVLEAGAGFGHFTVAATALGYVAEGVDFAPRIVAFAQQKYPSIRFFEGDVRRLSAVPDGYYDAVYSPGVCEHFEVGPEEVLLEARRILAPGGFLFVSTPCFCGFRKLLARLGWFRHEPQGEFFQYAFSVEEMTAILERLGFEVVETFGSGGLKSIIDHIPLMARLIPAKLERPMGGAITVLPVVGQWTAHSCIWVARKPVDKGPSTERATPNDVG